MIGRDLTVDEVMRRWPQTMPVFVKLKLNCVGCDMAPFETIADVATTYGIGLDMLLGELNAAARAAQDQAEAS